MRIKRVRVNGFDKLYEGYLACIKNNRAGFGDGLFSFLNHQMIFIELEDISTMELFYLKKFASSVKILDAEYINFISEEAPDLHQKIESLLETYNAVCHDSDMNHEHITPENMLPVGCHSYHVAAIFKGAKILSITGSLIQNIFKDEKGHFEEMYVGNMPMEGRLAGLFYNAFYSFISSEMTNLDIITEFIMDKSYYRFADSPCSLAHVNSPYGELVFYGNNQQGLAFQINYIKSRIQNLVFDLKEYVYLTFCLRTTFNTFVQMYLNCPYVIDHENLKLTFNTEEVLVDQEILNKYSARISDSISELNLHRKNLAQSSEVNLNKFNFIFNGNPVTYSIQIPLADLVSADFHLMEESLENYEIKNLDHETLKLSQIALGIFG